MHDGEPATGAILQRLTERLDGGVVLQRCWAATHPTSYAENYARILWTSAAMPARVCRDLANGCAGYLEAPPIKTDAPIYRAPTNRAFLRFLVRVMARGIRDLADRALRTEQWRVGVAQAPPESFLDLDATPAIDWIPNPGSGRFFADPFAVRVDGDGVRLIVEDYDHRKERGVLAELDWTPRGAAGRTTAIDDARHHSYPFVLADGGETYCIPEIATERRVDLYRRSPAGRWERVGTLLEDVAALDSTVFFHGGRWWLLLTDAEGPWNANLSAYHAPELQGPWTPHANNPVKLDVRSSRPAGPVFRRGDQLIRPAQDCSRSYGCRLALNRIIELTPTTMEEEVLGWVEPDPRGPCPDGFHTLVGAGPYTLVDGKRMELGLSMTAFRFSRKLGRLVGGG